VIEARSGGAMVARVVAGHPCRAEVDGDELLVGTAPLVAQVGASRWSGDEAATGTTLRKDGEPIVRIRDSADLVEVFDPQGGAMFHVLGDGTVANPRGEVIRRAEQTIAAIRVGDSVVTGTTDLPVAMLLTAPELIPEVRALAACHRLALREQRTEQLNDQLHGQADRK
jgi:hypothetical protein